MHVILIDLKAGIPVEVFEKQSFNKYQDRAGVWGMALHWSTYNVEACLPPEIFAHLKNAQTDPFTEVSDQFSKTIPLYNGKTGDLITHVEAEGPRRVHRGRLRDLLRTGLNVRFGKELHTFSVENSTVIASFNGGKEVWKGAYLVGADGRKLLRVQNWSSRCMLTFVSARSKVRSSTVPEGESQLEPAPIVVFVSVPTYQVVVFLYFALTGLMIQNFGATFTADQALHVRSQIHPVATVRTKGFCSMR